MSAWLLHRTLLWEVFTVFNTDDMRTHANDLLSKVEIVLEIILLVGVQHYSSTSAYGTL